MCENEQGEYGITLNEYYESVKDAFDKWIYQHLDQEGWESGDDIMYIWEHSDDKIMTNGFVGWYFDWKQAAMEIEAENYTYYRCSECGSTFDSDYECDCDEPDEDNYEELSTEEVVEWLDDIEGYISEYAIERAWDLNAHRTYVEALRNNHSDLVETIEEGLERLENYDDPEDLLVTLIYVTTVYHGGGELLQDYCYDLDYGLIDKVRNNGLISEWTREEIEEFLAEM